MASTQEDQKQGIFGRNCGKNFTKSKAKYGNRKRYSWGLKVSVILCCVDIVSIRPFPSSCLSLFQSESKYEVFVRAICSTLHMNEN